MTAYYNLKKTENESLLIFVGFQLMKIRNIIQFLKISKIMLIILENLQELFD